jgi:hypothetical protein
MCPLFTNDELREIRARTREIQELFRGVFANPNGKKVLKHLFDMFGIPLAEGEHRESLRYTGRMDVLIYMLNHVNVFGVEEDKQCPAEK